MAFTAIDSSTIKVGDPITKELLDRIKANFDDLDSRVSSLSTTGGSSYIYNGVLHLANLTFTDVFYYKIPTNLLITEFRCQLFSKGILTAGTLSFDLQKSSNTNNANFNTILATPLSFDFSSDASFSEKVASINSSQNGILAGQVLRLKVNSIPTVGFNDRVLIAIKGE